MSGVPRRGPGGIGFEILKNRTINRLWVDQGESVLAFETDAGIIAFETYGDCCSTTWFADVVGVDALLGQCVANVDYVKLPEVRDTRARYESAEAVDEVYGVKLTTARGQCDIIFRNSSNGYYGGDAHYEDRITSVDGMREITDDWSA